MIIVYYFYHHNTTTKHQQIEWKIIVFNKPENYQHFSIIIHFITKCSREMAKFPPTF